MNSFQSPDFLKPRGAFFLWIWRSLQHSFCLFAGFILPYPARNTGGWSGNLTINVNSPPTPST
jgi:hypothetical protein